MLAGAEPSELKRRSWVVNSDAIDGAGAADDGCKAPIESFSSSVIKLELTEGLGRLIPANSPLPPSIIAASALCSMEIDLLRW